ncbi:MAG: hypothetical protein MZW92_40120 [Comamonadaceae bacterium]|nr:hypothetical protein [Comamonadaceae bacterium]
MVARDRAPHLQRLHEVVHLPEAGPGRHPAGRDAHRSRTCWSCPGASRSIRLLTRWNPLDLRRPVPAAPTGKRVLVVGMGPAGFTLAHHLMNDGHARGRHRRPQDRAAARGVVRRAPRRPARAVRAGARRGGAARAAGRARDGGLRRRRRVRHHRALGQELPQGRSACCSSGARSSRMYGGVRFGGTLDAEERVRAWASTTSRSRPARASRRCSSCPTASRSGVRTASDFLMALQLTGAAKRDSIANMQVRLPVRGDRRRPHRDRHRHRVAGLLPGAGREVPRRATRRWRRERGEAAVRGRARTEEERRSPTSSSPTPARSAPSARRPRREGRAPRLAELVQSWGGVDDRLPHAGWSTAPSYTLNHEEDREGARGGHPLRRGPDAAGGGRRRARPRHARSSVSVQHSDGDGVWHERRRARLPARTILVAAGTQPNTVLAREDPGHVPPRRASSSGCCDEHGAAVQPAKGLAKPPVPAVLHRGAHRRPRSELLRRPASVVRRQRGEGHGQRQARLPDRLARARAGGAGIARSPDAEFFGRLDRELRATIERVDAAHADDRRGRRARAARPRALPARASSTGCRTSRRCAAEGGGHAPARWRAWRSPARGSTASAASCRRSCSRWADRPISAHSLKPGEPVVLMGPTGAPTEIEPGETVRAGRRRPRQRRAVLDRRRPSAPPARRCCTSPATRR